MAKPRKIILAEGNSADVELIKTAFERVGIPLEVTPVANGQELLNLVRTEYLGNIALVMMELDLPLISGLEVLKMMYNDDELKKLPVIVFSTSVKKSDVMACYEYGANAYVCKPSDPEDLNFAISAIANFWTEINVLPSYNGHELI